MKAGTEHEYTHGDDFMDDQIRWLVGIVVSAGLALVAALIGSFRNLAARISTGSRELHRRIDRVKDDYVRRDDLDGHIQRLDGNLRDLREEMREYHKQILSALNSK